MINNSKPLFENAARILSVSCGVLFVLFSFLYLYKIQGEMLAEAQFVFSKGVTTYSILIGAIVITLILSLLQFVVQLIAKIPTRWYSLSFFPSFLILTILTDINRKVFDDFTFGAWIWIVPVLLAVYILAIYWLKKIPESNSDKEHGNIYALLWPNYLIFLAMCVVTGSLQGAPDVYHYELRTERLILDGKYEEALTVGKKSLSSSRRLTELRAFAMAKNGQLGESLFEYPQYYGSAGLLDINDTLSHYRLSVQEICRSLGAYCGKSIKTTDEYLNLMIDNDTTSSQPLGDYYLCTLLLKKDLKTFASTLPEYYHNSDSLPKAYGEALLLLPDSCGSLKAMADTTLISKYKKYNLLKSEYKNPIERINKARRNFGKTYWWYYDFSDKVSK